MSSSLTPLQETLLTEFFNDPLSEGFFLSGGSALSWGYLTHRLSEDLDFFSREDRDLELLLRELSERMESKGYQVKLLRSGPNFRRLGVRNQDESTLLDFVTRDQPAVAPLESRGGVKLDSYQDIAVNKILALEREEIKDAVDLFLLLRDRDLDILELLRLARTKSLDAEYDWFPLQVAHLLREVDKWPNFKKLRLLKPIGKEEMTKFLADQGKLVFEQYR